MKKENLVGARVKFKAGPWIGRVGEVVREWDGEEYSVRIDVDDPSGPTVRTHRNAFKKLPRRRNEGFNRQARDLGGTRLDEGLKEVLGSFLKGFKRVREELPFKIEGSNVVSIEVEGRDIPLPAPKESEFWEEGETQEYAKQLLGWFDQLDSSRGEKSANMALKQIAILFGKNKSFEEAVEWIDQKFAALDAEYATENKSLVEMLWGKEEGRLDEVDCQSPNVELNKVRRDPTVKKKFSVCVKDGDSVKKVTFGDPDMSIRKSDDEARKSFRARHNCDNPGPKTKARYWACKTWEKGFDLP